MEMVPHFDQFRDLRGLIFMTAAKPVNVQFLKRNNIRLAFGDDFRNAARRQMAVTAQAAPHVVGQEPEGCRAATA